MIPTLLTVALLLVPTVAAQDVSASSVLGGGQEEWLDFDGVALIVNDEIVTLRELNELLGAARSRSAATTDEDNRDLLQTVAEEEVTLKLQAQAGAELGIEAADVQRTVNRYLADQRRGKSAGETESWLSAQGAADLGEMRREVTAELYRSFWVEGQRGKAAAGGRPFRDRYVRPGQLNEAYVVNQDRLGDPTTFRLQFLVLAINAWGDADTALEALVGFRDQIEAGADMGALVDEYGAVLRDSRGISEWMPQGQIPDPAVKAFCTESTEGALSEVTEVRAPDGSLQGYQLVRIVSRIEGQAPPKFSDAMLQTRLETLLQRSWDEERLTRGSDELWQTAFIRGPSRLQITPPWVRRSNQLVRRATEVDG